MNIDKHEPAIDNYEINERVKKIREILGLTQEQFGDRIGLSRTAIFNLENKNSIVSVQTIKLLYYELDVNVNYLLYEIGEPINYNKQKEDEIHSLFEEMTPEAQKTFLKIMDILNEDPRYGVSGPPLFTPYLD